MEGTIYQYSSITLAAGESRPVGVYARFLHILNNSTTSDVLVSIGGQSEQQIPQGIGVKIADSALAVTTLNFRNNTAGTMTIIYAVASGEIFDSRSNFSGTLTTQPVGVATANVPGNNSAAISNTVSTEIIAANSNRQSFSVFNPITNGGIYLRLGSACNTTNHAVYLTPGAYYEPPARYTGTVHALAVTNGQTVKISEV